MAENLHFAALNIHDLNEAVEENGPDEVACGLLPLQQQIAVDRNNRKLAELTLGMLCLKAVVRNREFFTKAGPSSAPQHRLENLPLVLRDALIKMVYIMRVDELCCSFREHPLISGPLVMKSYSDFVARLLQHDTTNLSLPFCWRSNQVSSIEDLLQVVGNTNRPAFRSIKSNVINFPDEEYFRNYDVFFRAFPQLPNLQIVDLQLEICMGDKELEQFAKYTHQLVVLIISGLDDEVSSVGFEALSKLPYLRKFFFGGRNMDFDGKFALLCAQYLPKLKMISRNFSADISVSSMGLRELHSGSFHKPILEAPQTVPLGLEQIFLTGRVRPHQSCQLPDLKLLVWLRPRGDVLAFVDRFSTITELTLLKADVDRMMVVLQTVGRRLTKLHLGLARRALPFAKILQLCPNLECLNIELCTFEAWARWPAPKDFCTHLEEFSLDMDYEPLPRGFIVKLMGAPRLRQLNLGDTCLSSHEVDDLLVLVRQNHILGNILKFTWFNSYMAPENLQEWMADEDHFNLLLDNIQVAFPHLDTINYIKNREQEDAEVDADIQQILRAEEVKSGPQVERANNDSQ